MIPRNAAGRCSTCTSTTPITSGLSLACPRQCRRRHLRGEVVERFTTQFIYDPPRMVTAAGGVIDQQGRPFTHAYEIYFEKATLFFSYAALAKVGDAVTPLSVLLDNGKVLRPKLGSGDPPDAFVAELGEVLRAVRNNTPSPLLAGELARDAIVLCQKQTESVLRGRAVKV